MSDRKYFVDLPMLDKFTAYHKEHLQLYACMLEAIRNAYDAISFNAVEDIVSFLEETEIKADEIAAILSDNDSYGIGDEYLMVNDFLDGLRCGLVGKGWRYQGIEFRNDHSMVETVIGRAALRWQGLRKKYQDDNILAIKAFQEEMLDSLPDVNTLYALLAAEYAKAREILLVQPEPPRSV